MNRRVLLGLAISVGLLATQSLASASSFNGLVIPGGGTTIQTGDKLFSNFGCSITNSVGFAGPTDCSSINVISFTDALGNFGIRYQATFIASGGAPGGISNVDVLLTYDVTSLAGTTISDAHLGFDGHTIGNTAGLVGDISETITELSPTPGVNLGALNVHTPPPVLNDFIVFNHLVHSARVTKDVSVTAFGANAGTVLFSTIDQTWSQNGVPEPGTIALFGSALIGCAAILRRRVKRSS